MARRPGGGYCEVGRDGLLYFMHGLSLVSCIYTKNQEDSA